MGIPGMRFALTLVLGSGSAPVNRSQMEQLLRNLDRRMARVEQILPTLATQAELGETRSELRTEIRAEGERTRRHFDIVGESLRDDIRLLAEGLVSVTERLDRI